MINDETAIQLRLLGILDDNDQITPDAYQGAIANKPVIEQAEILGLPIIYRPFRTDEYSPEMQFVRFFQKRVNPFIEGGESWATEGYIIKSLLSSLIPEFDYRKKKHNYNEGEIEHQISRLRSIDLWDVVMAQEGFYDNINISYKFDSKPKEEFSFLALKRRFQCCEIYYSYSDEKVSPKEAEEAKSKEREKNYSRVITKYIALWESLPLDDWLKLARMTLIEWSKLYAGWPDITIFSKETGLMLVEIKGKDKIHASQVYTLLKLKEILGEKRMAIGLINNGQINSRGFQYKEHTNNVISWLNSTLENRKKINSLHV